MTDRAQDDPKTTTTVTAKGHNGTVTFDGTFVTITRRGALARLTVGKGEKRFPVRNITSVQWKPPGAMVNGYIEFSLGGGNEARSAFGRQSIDASRNENAVMVTRRQRDDFLALREAVETAMAASS